MNKHDPITLIPKALAERFRTWRKKQSQKNLERFQHLAEHGQNPQALVISCCDSRVNVMELFSAESGEFFIHRNIANLVPPIDSDGINYSTAAAIEYGVTVLHVPQIIILGHSGCGGIKGAFDLFNADESQTSSEPSFIEQWLQIVRPAFDQLDHDKPIDDRIKELEQKSVLVSIKHLTEFPFVKKALGENRLTIHGLWHDVAASQLYSYNPQSGGFEAC